MSLSDLSRNKPALKALALRFTYHDFEKAYIPTPPILNTGRYIPLASAMDLSGKPVEYGDLILGTTFLAHCHVPLSQPAANLVACWHESSIVHAFQHYIISDGHCFDFNWKENGEGGTIAIDEILASPVYAPFWETATSYGRAPQRSEFYSYFLPQIVHHQEANSDKVILRSDWHNAMLLINPEYPPFPTNVVTTR